MYIAKQYNKYDSSLKLYINCGEDSSLAKSLGAKKSTIHYWKTADFSFIIFYTQL